MISSASKRMGNAKTSNVSFQETRSIRIFQCLLFTLRGFRLNTSFSSQGQGQGSLYFYKISLIVKSDWALLRHIQFEHSIVVCAKQTDSSFPLLWFRLPRGAFFALSGFPPSTSLTLPVDCFLFIATYLSLALTGRVPQLEDSRSFLRGGCEWVPCYFRRNGQDAIRRSRHETCLASYGSQQRATHVLPGFLSFHIHLSYVIVFVRC